jgi:DNA-binding NtrC family response regulator
MSVLIIDEDADVRVWLQQGLGVETRTAATLELGIFEAGNWQPGVILLDGDTWQTNQQGVEYVRRLKQECPRAEIVVMVEKLNDTDSSLVFKQGASAYAEKGDIDRVISLIDDARRRVQSVVAPASPSLH